MRLLTRTSRARPPAVRPAVAAALAALLVVAIGCEFSNSERRKVEASTAADVRAMREEIGRLQQDVDALEAELARSDDALRSELAALRRSIGDLDTKSARLVAAAKKELVDKINEIERNRIGDKNALNKKMDAIVAEVQRALGGAASGGPASGGETGTRTVRGFEYTVKEGDTVSAIAAKFRDKYGTTTKAILEANNLSANSIIRPGDVLVIPVKE
jgi:LysM repeat protein